jgi:hypothetical protein
MKLLVQRVGARSFPKFVEVDDKVAANLQKIMIGLVEVFDQKASGGKAVEQTPDPLNRVRISVRAIDNDGSQISCAFQVPHVNPAVDYKTLDGLVRGKFDAYWSDKTVKCSDVAIIYDKVAVSGSKK